ncbi:MAG: RNA methyltransferase [Planctomycetota bacterium]|nr:RNA methyltransferase [Planctomycetota bacterium]MCB9825146.1 RNA methyltransferase [Planctomycetota bacterium]MCB9901968.1 RNA methyltransferase [Planctomycetota bacterium]
MQLSIAGRKRLAQIARGKGDPGLHLLEGLKAVHDALATGHVVEVWRRDNLAADTAIAFDRACADAGLEVGLAKAADLDRVGGVRTPQGIVAVVRDPQRSPDEVLAQPGWVLWLDGLQDPGNVGSAFRVAVAFGAAGLLVSDDGAHPLGAKALRASAGLALAVPFARGPSAALAAAVRLDGRAAWVLEAGGRDVFEVVQEIETPGVLVVGSEGRGPGEHAHSLDPEGLGVPIEPGAESLNAAVALGVAFAVLVRSRRA